MKRIITLLLATTMIFVLSSCESENVKNAKAAYNEGKYSEVVELLSQEEDLSDSSKDMLTVSEANVLFESKDYVGAVKKLVTSSKGTQEDQYEEMFKAALDASIANHSSEGITELLTLDETKTDAIYEAITEACKNKDYNGFLVLDGLVAGLEDGDLKTKLSSFSDEYNMLRAEAFLVGTWERQNEGVETNAIVKIVPYKKNFIGKLATVGDDQKQWHFQEDDIFMHDFEFEDDHSFLYTNLVRFDDGTPDQYPSSGTIDYEKNIIVTKTTGVSNPEVTYKRITE